MVTTRNPATDPLTPSGQEPDQRTWALHWVYPEPRVTQLGDGDVTIGRDVRCDVVLDDTRVSRRHATISSVPGGAPRIRDDGSSNHLIVDGKECEQALLSDGSVLRIGDTLGVVVHTELSGELPQRFGDVGAAYIGSGKILEALRFAERAAATKDPVFVNAETGTGKEYFARLVHATSGRRGAFITVNCASLQGSLALSTLFGHQRGAFTGAERAATGLFQAADGGTLFLDEVAELPADAQAMLLRAAQDGEFKPLGALQSQHANVRLVSATHVDLLDRACTGGFRADLYYRLTTHQVRLCALRERREDIMELFCAYSGVDRRVLKPAIALELLTYAWPGNIRELQNVAATLKVREPEPDRWTTNSLRVVTRSLPAPPAPPASAHPPPVSRASAEPPNKAALLTRDDWLDLYHRHGGVAAQVAAATGYSPSAVKRHLARFGIKR